MNVIGQLGTAAALLFAAVVCRLVWRTVAELIKISKRTSKESDDLGSHLSDEDAQDIKRKRFDG